MNVVTALIVFTCATVVGAAVFIVVILFAIERALSSAPGFGLRDLDLEARDFSQWPERTSTQDPALNRLAERGPDHPSEGNRALDRQTILKSLRGCRFCRSVRRFLISTVRR